MSSCVGRPGLWLQSSDSGVESSPAGGGAPGARALLGLRAVSSQSSSSSSSGPSPGRALDSLGECAADESRSALGEGSAERGVSAVEAVLCGSLLFKPDMSHLDTWPDVFVPFETYVPFSWDATDLLEKAEYYLAHEHERKRIAANAYDSFRQQTTRMEQRLESILNLVGL